MILAVFNTLYYRYFVLATSATLVYVLGVQLSLLSFTYNTHLGGEHSSGIVSVLGNSSMTTSNSTYQGHDGPRNTDGGWTGWISDDQINPDDRMPNYLQIQPNASQSEIAEYRSWAIQTQKNSIQRTMRHFYFLKGKLKEFLLDSGGQPMRNVIFTTWRSGSTFLGDLLANHPGTFYHYEPLIHWGIIQVHESAQEKEAIQLFQDILQCNYTNLPSFFERLRNRSDDAQNIFRLNSRVGKYCKELEICIDPNWLSQMCQLFPIQLIKTVRIRLKFARSLLEDPKHNVRLLYLVRDPRGTILSRWKLEWCRDSPVCGDPANLCTDLAQDFDEAQKLEEKFPTKFAVIRYEDMCSNISKATQEIYAFFGLRFTPKTQTFLLNHAYGGNGNASDYYRKTSSKPFQWIRDMSLNFTRIQSIQNDCKAAMDLWGYEMLNSIQDRQRFKPVKLPQWPRMILSANAYSVI